MITACLIAKNEEKWMNDFLTHLKGQVEEIVLVDTGSTDSTCKIAESHGVKIFKQEWNGDFSRARNFSLEKATQPWILVLDPDERVSEEDFIKIKRIVKSAQKSAYIFSTRNYAENLTASGFKPCKGEYASEEKSYPGYFESKKIRLFRNNEGIHFVGIVHELVESTVKGPIGEIDIPVHHYGSDRSSFAYKQKQEFYESISLAKAKANPTDWRAQYELGISLLESKKWKEAAETLEMARAMNPKELDILVNLGLAYLDNKDFELCQKVLEESLTYHPNNYGALFNLSVLEVRRQHLDEAVKRLIALLRVHPESFAAYRILGLCFMAANQTPAATKCFEEAVRLCPRYSDARMDLGMSYMYEGKLDLAKKTVDAILVDLPTEPRALEIKAQLESAQVTRMN